MTASATPRTKGPPKEVTDYWSAKGLKPSFNWADVWQEEHRAAFTVAGVMEQDILIDLRDSVAKAISEGQSYAKFRKQTTALLADKGWLGRKTQTDPITGETKDVNLGEPHRLATIFDTNVRTARAAGQWQRAQRTAAALPYMEYRIGPSRKHRPEHVTFDKLILPISHPFWNTHYPPNGYGCKCSARQISKFEATSKGGVSPTPAVPTVGWRNPRTGEELQVPLGVDPGFAFNPGKDRFGGLK
jgi:uncharacterized protein with gpF-like domain